VSTVTTPTPVPAPPGAYRQTASEVVTALGTAGARGLRGGDARARLARYGPNERTARPPTPPWRRLLARTRHSGEGEGR
jgi:hypothetical protein